MWPCGSSQLLGALTGVPVGRDSAHNSRGPSLVRWTIMWSAAVSSFDQSVIFPLNSLVGRYPHFDKAIDALSQNDLKDSIFVAMFWWYWFAKAGTETLRRTREHLLCTLGAGVVAILAARILALTLPFRVRPRFEPALHFVVPAGNVSDLVDWSAFPSDHAAMFSAFAVGMCFISWRTGLIAMLYTIFIICLPR